MTHCRLPPQALDPGTGTIVSNDRFVGQYEIQNDGSFVEGGPSEGQTMVDPNSTVRRRTHNN